MKRTALTPPGRIAWLRLARTRGVGPVTFNELIRRFKTAEAALDALPDLAKRGGRATALKPASREEAEAEMDWLDRIGARLLCACEPEFPDSLAVTDPPPPVITTLGPLELETRVTCAMVGARSASGVGLRFAGTLARELGERGVIVVSGLARGIDGAAHAGSLDTGTVAVLAGGLTSIYPPEHRDLHAAIAEKGLLVSESPPGYTPQARDFPRRNRLISGLSIGVVVVEAAERSGSLITARYALEQGREVMAVPGSPLDPRARGANRLLRDGAALIETAEDVVALLEGARRGAMSEPAGGGYEGDPEYGGAIDRAADDVRERVAALLSPSPISRDELVRLSGAPAPIVMAALVELELAGRCEMDPGGMVRLAV
ncbi:MAG: DNA-processing protein DprA [Oceanicaulis sp.]|uniref:DNA-processing protein DprA n=1 Tax=Glycocaulis sp. TaxID=1969725 RepID=UPI0025BFFF48|nr:DNA-processing protein DprA [Glycocaulis sp.]MCC5981486.1 DNA-processing protein DprA [Oceanicaulis sp.]MCH8522430.1 DNA-processing protein DprA [Glycocaulis sp.]